MRGREIVPLVRFNIVLCHYLAFSIHDGKVVLGTTLPLGRCQAVQLESLSIVLRYKFARA